MVNVLVLRVSKLPKKPICQMELIFKKDKHCVFENYQLPTIRKHNFLWQRIFKHE